MEAIAPVPLKVILEIAYLTDNEIKQACQIVVASGAAFVKTGTGWTPGGATVERIRLIAGLVKGAVGLKASGGIRSLETVATMVALGVTRFSVTPARRSASSANAPACRAASYRSRPWASLPAT